MLVLRDERSCGALTIPMSDGKCPKVLLKPNPALVNRYPPKTGRSDYRSWYNLQRWHHIAKAHLRKEPLCRMCSRVGKLTAATVADHIEPHAGDLNKFWFGKLQSLCKQCHDSTKRKDEIRGYSTEIGLDGYPVDIKHPVYSGKGKRIKEVRRTTYKIADGNVRRLIPMDYDEDI
jgi:5-methylcytosine-specific restriction enzyme A